MNGGAADDGTQEPVTAQDERFADELFDGGGASGALMSELDWAGTPVGPVEQWPQSLRSAVRILLSSRYPMLLLWGEGFTQIYNDAYSALIGDKHPDAMGGDVRITLAEGWEVLGPIVDEAMTTGVASWVPALQLLLERAGYREEAYFSVSHGPARDDDGRTVGVLTVCSEVTEQVVGGRRLRLLRDLSLRAEQTHSVERTCAELTDAISDDPLDVPFAAIYLREAGVLRRVSCFGADDQGADVAASLPATPAVQDENADPWGLVRAATATAATTSARTEEVGKLVRVPGGPWGDLTSTALALPLTSVDREQPLGVLLVGVSPSRGLDEGYVSFFELLVQQVSVALRNARAYEQERARAEALAELDRVKTGFFTNVSHEFRTPLTLMLGPLGDALGDETNPLGEEQRERVETARRNATRLLKLVNNLLTFASLEAGRAQTSVQVLDLSELTLEIASAFRAGIERAGLSFVVDASPLAPEVSLDPASWEKIVANLLSNALKFTFVGQIRLSLHADDDAVQLEVADTGIGIPEEELSRLFERFHRVQGSRSRSHEGSGIGLALVQELARLHGGEVRVASEVGRGTTFAVSLPLAALQPRPDSSGDPGDRPSVRASGTTWAAAEEAAHWLVPDIEVPDTDVAVTNRAEADQLAGARVLVADDNSDMRAYLTRLLRTQGWSVEAVGDGQAALDAARRQLPDLLLTDVMMPELDGFELVRALRSEEATSSLPILVLSARAGQEASVEGLDLGADDYVVKPFVATELIARARSTMTLARARRAHTRQQDADPADRLADRRLTPAPVAAAAGVRPVEAVFRYPSRAQSASAMRRDLRHALNEAGVGDDIAFELLLAASEAVNNAVEHAQAPTRPEVEIRIAVSPERAQVVVQDFGSWRERQSSMDRGHGSTLMSAFGDVRVMSTSTGTAVTLERQLV